MSGITIIALAAFFGVAALVGGIALLIRDQPSTKMEDRLDVLAGTGSADPSREGQQDKSLLSEGFDSGPSLFESLIGRFGNVNLVFEQANTNLTPAKLFLISIVLGGAVFFLGILIKIPLLLLPIFAFMAAALPLGWLMWRRSKRLKNFASQLPDALELLARALRAGQSLSAGMNMVATEMSDPVGVEFGRVSEEQNLGIGIEDSLREMCNRIPNLDLKFFATAVILQRQTGGDLAEILDKIGGLVRERFQIWGQVQALTGEGRLSGIVLMALPAFLMVIVYYLNPDYVMQLFTDPMGKKMLAGAVILQILGALVIRKIVNIKV